MPAPVAALVSFRLGGTDGVSVESAKWAGALLTLGWRVETVAGTGPVDHLLPGLAMDADDPPTASELSSALAGADLVVVENLCSLPLNVGAADAVSKVLAGRPAVLHHHDLPWQREQFAGFPPPPDDPAWLHVTINDLSRTELAAHGITATVVRNRFDPDPPAGRRATTRGALGLHDHDLLVMQPTRAIPRKNVAGAIALAASLGATYWLLGPAEDGYGPELELLLDRARVSVVHGHGPGGVGRVTDDAYAASDVIALPSTWEGFGNPAVESAVHRRPLAIGTYPVGRELAAYGFRWFDVGSPQPLASWLERTRSGAGDGGLIDHNHAVARRHFSLHDLPAVLEPLLASLGLSG